MNRFRAIRATGIHLVIPMMIGLASCQKPSGSAETHDSTANASANASAKPRADTPSTVLPSLGDTVDLATTIDTTAPKPLAHAPAALAADTIPLRAPDGSPARYGLRSGRVVLRFTGNSRG